MIVRTCVLAAVAVTGMATWGAAVPAPATAAMWHCQIPCGIYGDQTRVTMLLEDATTLEKSMKMIAEISASEEPNHNQLVRWVVNKEEHAKKIQQQCLDYWLAQRIKPPKDESGAKLYRDQLSMIHGIIVAAMKCKQSTEVAHVTRIRELTMKFSESYFSEDDMKHIKEHHGSGHR